MRQADMEARENKINARIGEFWKALEQGRGCEGLEDGELTRITVRFPSEEHPEALLIVKATAQGQAHIGFVGALTVAQALLTWRARDGAGGLKWREDVPWEER